ncbi:MAG: nucleotide sugar dehydrogenase [Candidatus Caldarchaeum sp.]
MDTISRIKNREAKICVIGLGYVGLPLAVEKAKAGFKVIGIEALPDRVEKVNRGESYIPDVLNLDIQEVVKIGNLRATSNYDVINDVDVITICVPTPLGKNKQPDTSYIEYVTDQSLPYLRKYQLMVLESTTYPGTTEEILLPKIESRGFKVGEDFFLAFSPERVDPGNRQFKVKNTPKVVGGVTPRCTEIAKTLYETIIQEKVFTVSSPRVAEMTKLLENSFRIVNVSLVNELAMLCDKMGIDIWEVIEAASTKPFGFMPFYPGPGIGGHCIPLDPFYLEWKAKEYDFATRFIELAGEINDSMPEYVVARAAEILNAHKKCLNGARVLLLGIAYKKDVDDLRESPALKVAQRLLKWGAHIAYHDPYIPSCRIADKEYSSVPLTPQTLKEFDLVIVTTDHSNVDYKLVVQHASLIYDTRNALKGFTAPHIFRLGAPNRYERSR